MLDPTPQPVEAAPTPQPEPTPADPLATVSAALQQAADVIANQQHKPGEPLYLSAPGEFKPYPGVLAGRPKEVSGQPASYFWKDLVGPGNYTNHARGFTLSASNDRIKKWCSTGKAMLAAGVDVPIVLDHSERARDSRGYIVDFELREGRLFGLCQFIGEDAPVTAARNKVSIGYQEDFTDSQNHRWGDAITHVALTPVPVVPGQSEFLKAASRLYPDAPASPEPENNVAAPAAAERTAKMPSTSPPTCSQADYDLLHDSLVGVLKKLSVVTEDEIEPSTVTFLMSRAGEKLDGLLSRPSRPAPPDPAALHFGSIAAAALEQRVIDTGYLPAYVAGLKDDVILHPRDFKTLTLSRTNQEGDDVFAKELGDYIKILTNLVNHPPVAVKTGQKTKTQTLSRVTPGEPEPEDKPAEPVNPLLDTANRMAGIAAK